MTDVALDRFVQVNRSRQALAAAHVVLIARGSLVALLLVVSAPSISALFGIPQFANSFALAGIVPFIGGFAHLGIKQIQRDYRYGPDSIAKLVSNIAAVATLVIAAQHLHNHNAIIFGFGAEALCYVVLTHLLSSETYGLRPDATTLREVLWFGVPLTLNGVALATVSQLDRVVVGHWFGVGPLGQYAVILSLAVTPVSFLQGTTGTLGLSFLLSAKEDTSVTSENYHLLAFVFSTLAILYTFGVVLTLDILTPYVFGPTFTVPPTLHALIAVMVFLRLQRGGAPTVALLATGRTGELALLNLPAGVGLLFAVGLVSIWPSLESVVLGVVIGDFIDLGFFFFASTPARAASRTAATPDIAISFLALTGMVGTFLWMPQATWQARGTVLLAGLLAIAVQLAYGWNKHRGTILTRLKIAGPGNWPRAR